MKNKLVPFLVTHVRKVPKLYKFTHKFFFFKIDLFNLDSLNGKMVTYNKPGLYSFYDCDHLDLGKVTAKENYFEYFKQNGVIAKITEMEIYTQLRFMNYVFNPVSFILARDENDKRYAIIEVGNTFNELKPFFVNENFFNNDGFSIKTRKFFYISPFIKHDNDLEFNFIRQDDKLSINVYNTDQSERILNVALSGQEKLLTKRELFKQTLTVPFITFKIIGLIHIHALMLWVKGIKFYRKSEYKELQKGTYRWKTSKKEMKLKTSL